MINFMQAEIGLEVNEPRFGNGSIVLLGCYLNETCQLRVKFKNTTEYFMSDGRYLPEEYPTLRVGHFNQLDQGVIPEKEPKPLQFDGTPTWAYVAVNAEHINKAKCRGKRLIVAQGSDGYAAIQDGYKNTESSGISHWKFAWEIEDD